MLKYRISMLLNGVHCSYDYKLLMKYHWVKMSVGIITYQTDVIFFPHYKKKKLNYLRYFFNILCFAFKADVKNKLNFNISPPSQHHNLVTFTN